MPVSPAFPGKLNDIFFAYLVGLYGHDVRRFREEGWLDELSDGLYIWLGDYDERLGIVPAIADPADLIVGG